MAVRIDFTIEEVNTCKKFANDMKGNHNVSLIQDRTEIEIYRDDLRGKLSEIAVQRYFKYIKGLANVSELDYEARPLTYWDTQDLRVNDKNISIKSIKPNSDFLMIECKRFSPKGNGAYSYLNNNGKEIIVDFYVLVKVYLPEFDETPLSNRDDSTIYSSAIQGYISHSDFWKYKHYAPKGILCTKDNLTLVCKNSNPIIAPKGTEQHMVLQQDNYIFSSHELQSITLMDL